MHILLIFGAGFLSGGLITCVLLCSVQCNRLMIYRRELAALQERK